MRTVLHEILDRGSFSPVTRAKYAKVIDEWVAFAGSEPSGWTRDQAQVFYDQLCARMKTRSANVRIASLRYVSKWFALKQGDPSRDFAIVQTGAAEEPTGDERRHALAPDDAIALLATCIEGKTAIDRRDRTVLVIGLETGMRSKSLAGALLEKFSTRGAYPLINVPIKGRGGEQTFDVPLSDLAAMVLSDWATWLKRSAGISKGFVVQRMTRHAQIVGGKEPRTEVTYEPTGQGVSGDTIYDIIVKRAEEAGIRHVHPHLLRHTFVTWRHDAGLDAPSIASITGHKVDAREWGELPTYIDPQAVGGRVRNTTPDWLASFVRSRI